jgi:CheY-like chemotaxis protein
MTVAANSAARRVLIVEDDHAAREGLGMLLRDEGFVVSEAEDGAQGLARLLDFKPDAALCDLDLPKLGGIELVREAHKRGIATRFVLMIGSGRTGVEQAKAVRADAWILKPLNLSAVLLTLQQVLAIP